jgi:hypothetical protein
MTSASKKSYAQVTFFEKVTTIGHAFLLRQLFFASFILQPFNANNLSLATILIWSLFTKQLYPESRAKGLIRHISDVSLNHLTKLKPAKLQFFLGTTESVYRTWAQNSNVPIVEEDLGENAKLFWLGPKRPNKVILYLHGEFAVAHSHTRGFAFFDTRTIYHLGGAFLLPATEQALSFWKYVQEQLTGKDNNMGVAILQYSESKIVISALF